MDEIVEYEIRNRILNAIGALYSGNDILLANLTREQPEDSFFQTIKRMEERLAEAKQLGIELCLEVGVQVLA